MGARIPLPLIPPEADEVIGEEIDEEINPDEVEFGEEIDPNEVEFGEEIAAEEIAPEQIDAEQVEFGEEINPDEVEFGEALPQVLGDESGIEPFDYEDEAGGAAIQMADITSLGRYAEKAYKFFSQALEADNVVYKAASAAQAAFQQGFSPAEVAEIAWEAMTDLERLHQPEMQDYIFMSAIQAGAAPQQAREESNRFQHDVGQMANETVMAVSNFVPGMPVVRKAAVPFKNLTKWVAKLPAQISVGLPKQLLHSAFSLPPGMFDRVSKRHIQIEKAADFFKPFEPNQTVFDVYANKLATLYRELEKDYITNLVETRETLREGVRAEDLFFALKEATNEKTRMVGNTGEISTEFNKIVSNIMDTVRSDISGSSNVQRIQGLDVKNKVKFNKDHILNPHKVRDIMASIDDRITFAREKLTPEPEKVKMLASLRKKLNTLLGDLDGNIEYKSRMDDLNIDRLRLDNFAEGFGVSKSKRKAVEGADGGIGVEAEDFIDDAFKKINGQKIAGYANEISTPERSGRMSDNTISIALRNMEKILEKRPELRKDFFTTNDVLMDLATSEALKKSTIQGSRKVGMFSVAAGAIGTFLGVPKSAYLFAGAAAGGIADTNGREIGAAFIRNFVAETSLAQKLVIKPISKVHGGAQKVFADSLDTFAPGLASAMIRRYIEGDVSAFDEQTGTFKVDDWAMIHKAINAIQADDNIPTVKKMNQIVDFVHEFRKTGSVTMQIGGYGEDKKGKNETIENLKKFEPKTMGSPDSGWGGEDARGTKKQSSPDSGFTSDTEAFQINRKTGKEEKPEGYDDITEGSPSFDWGGEDARGKKKKKQ